MDVRTLAVTLWVAPSLALAAAPAESPLVGRARQSDRVVLARVAASRVDVPDGNVRRMVTATSLEVLAEYKGQGPKRVELLQLGGKHGPWESHVAGDAVFEVGERAVVFLRCRNPAAPASCVLVGLADGKLKLVAGDAAKGQVLVRVNGEPVKRPLEAVVDEIRQAGRVETKDPKGAP